MADPIVANTTSNGLPSWGSPDLTNLLTRAPRTPVSQATQKWYAIEDEVERLRERLATLNQAGSDRVMA